MERFGHGFLGLWLVGIGLLGAFGAITGRLPAMLAALFAQQQLVAATSGLLPGLPPPEYNPPGGSGPSLLPYPPETGLPPGSPPVIDVPSYPALPGGGTPELPAPSVPELPAIDV